MLGRSICGRVLNIMDDRESLLTIQIKIVFTWDAECSGVFARPLSFNFSPMAKKSYKLSFSTSTSPWYIKSTTDIRSDPWKTVVLLQIQKTIKAESNYTFSPLRSNGCGWSLAKRSRKNVLDADRITWKETHVVRLDDQRWANSVFGTEYEYDYYSVSEIWPNTNTNTIRV